MARSGPVNYNLTPTFAGTIQPRATSTGFASVTMPKCSVTIDRKQRSCSVEISGHIRRNTHVTDF